MRALMNLFFSIVLPISALFIIFATIYFSMNYELNKALRLGMLAGFIIGFGFSIIMSVILFIMRKARTQHIRMTHPESHIEHESTNGPIDKKFMLLMDKELAFEVALYSLIYFNIDETYIPT